LDNGMNKQLTQQNLRELARLTFLNLMSVNGVMAKTIIRNYKQKQEREVKKNDYISQAKKIFI
jgi:hypothetical protein